MTACSNQITPKIILPLVLSINRKAWKNRPMLKMFWILPLAENTTKIIFLTINISPNWYSNCRTSLRMSLDFHVSFAVNDWLVTRLTSCSNVWILIQFNAFVFTDRALNKDVVIWPYIYRTFVYHRCLAEHHKLNDSFIFFDFMFITSTISKFLQRKYRVCLNFHEQNLVLCWN